MSQSAVSRIWRAFGLKPHLTETFNERGEVGDEEEHGGDDERGGGEFVVAAARFVGFS